MSVETIARRYASALADVVLKNGEAAPVKEELKIWETLVNANSDLNEAFANPAIAHFGKERVLEDLLARSKPLHTTANFLRVLLKNGRLTELEEINERFAAELDERQGIVSANVTSARSLPETEQRALKNNLENLTGKKVNLNFEINEEIIGGVITRVGSTVYDGSVKTQLENLKEEMING